MQLRNIVVIMGRRAMAGNFYKFTCLGEVAPRYRAGSLPSLVPRSVLGASRLRRLHQFCREGQLSSRAFWD